MGVPTLSQDTRRRPSTPSGGQGFQTATRRTSPGAPGAKPAGQQPRLRVVLSVPEFRVIFGEEVVVVGSCEELGDWNVATAPRLQVRASSCLDTIVLRAFLDASPGSCVVMDGCQRAAHPWRLKARPCVLPSPPLLRLQWQEGNTWVGQVHLPPGTHTFKLVVVRQDGFASWEEVRRGVGWRACAGSSLYREDGLWEQARRAAVPAGPIKAHMAAPRKRPHPCFFCAPPPLRQGPDRELEVPEGAAAVAAAARTGLHVKCGYGDWQPVDVSLATAAQLDALLLPTPTMPAGAQPPAPADSYMAGDEVLGAPTQNGNAKAAAMSAARLAAARILEPSSTLSPATA